MPHSNQIRKLKTQRKVPTMTAAQNKMIRHLTHKLWAKYGDNKLLGCIEGQDQLRLILELAAPDLIGYGRNLSNG